MSRPWTLVRMREFFRTSFIQQPDTRIYYQIFAQCLTFIMQSSYMFLPYILAFFRELQFS